MAGLQFNIDLGEAAPIRASHPLRTTGKFVRAVITDTAGTPVAGSPFTLTDDGGGYYSTEAWTPAANGQYYGQVDFYDDAGFTTLSPEVGPLSFNFTVNEQVTQIDRLHTDYTTARAGAIDNLDATITSRESETDAASRAATDVAEHDATQAAIAALPSANAIADQVWDEAAVDHDTAGSMGELQNTIADIEGSVVLIGNDANFQSSVPFVLDRPETGTQDVKVFARLYRSNGNPQDPQGQTLNIEVQDVAGTVLAGPDTMTRTAQGQYEYTFQLTSASALGPYYIVFDYNLGGNSYNRITTTNIRDRVTESEIADAVWDEARGDHTVAGSFGEGAQGVLSVVRADNLDNLDATVSSRQSETDAASRAAADIGEHNQTQADIAALENLSIADVQTGLTNQGYTTGRAPNLDNLDATVSSRATQTSVDNIQNSTRFQMVVPELLKKPDTGSKDYKFYGRLFDTSGNPEDPDANTVNVRIEQTDGTVVVATTAMTRTAQGQYEYTYAVNAADTEQPLVVFMEYDESSVSFQQIRTTEVVEFESKLDSIQSDVTAIKNQTDQFTFTGANVNANAQVVSDKTGYTLTTVDKNDIVDRVWDEALADHVAVGSMGANQNLIDDIESDTSGLRADYTTGRAGNLDNLDATVSSRESDADALSRYNDLVSEHTQTQTDISNLNDLSIADVQTGLDNQGYTTVRATNLDNLDATVSSRESDADANTRAIADQASHTQTQADIAALENLSEADIQNALDTQGYTSARAANLDNLDVAISSREAEVDADTRQTALLAEHTQTQADIAALNDPTAAAIADAVWDEARADHINVGSFGEGAQGVLSTSRANNLDLIDASVTSRQAESDAASRAAADQAEHAQTQSDIANLQISVNPGTIADAVWDESRADHQAAGSFGEGAQGVVSVTRANNLDFLDVSVLSRASQASVDNIEAIGRFTGVVPARMIKDLSGPKVYTFYGKLFDINGNPNDPDNNDMFIRVEEPDGTVVVANTTMTRTAAGQYEFDYTVLPSDPERALLVFFTYVEDTIPFEQIKTSEVADEDSKLDVLLNRLTQQRADNLDNLDEPISTREAEVDAAARAATDESEHNLTQVQIAAVQGDVTQIRGKTDQLDFFGGNVRARAEVVVDKTGYSLATGEVASIVDAVWDELQSAHTIPGSFGQYLDDQVSLKEDESDAASRAANNQVEHDATQATLAGVESDVTAIKAKTDNLAFTGTNVHSEVQTNLDKTDYELSVAEKATIVDQVWDEPNADHLIAGSTGENLANAGGASSPAQIADAVWDELRAGHTIVGSYGEALQGVITTTRANNLDFLDASITSRASQASVDTIQNNTRFIGIVPTKLILPVSGTKDYKLYVRLYNTAGTPEDPDSNAMNYRIEDVSGTVVVPTATMNRTGVGLYEVVYTVNDTDTERPLNVFFEYLENGVPFQQVRTTEVVEFESKLDTLLSRLTQARADNLDNLDVTISSRQAESDALSRFNSLISEHDQTQVDIAAVAGQVTIIDGKVDVIDGNVDAIKAQTDLMNFNGANILAEAVVISDKDDYSLSVAAQDALVDKVWDELLAGHAIVGSAGATLNRVDVDLSSRASAVDLAAVAVQVDRLHTDYTTPRAVNLDNLDVAVSTRATQASVDAVPDVNQIADQVWDEPIADHLTAGSTGEALNDAGGSTSPSAIADAVWDEARADHVAPGSFGEALDVPVSTRATQASVDAIPTNPVLDNDPRLDNLDAPISSVSGGGSTGGVTPEIIGTVTESESISGTVEDSGAV